jgi:hypothetical protein
MNESTRVIIAYATLLFGIPMLAAKMVWLIPSAISARTLPRIAGRLDRFTDAAIEGFISLLLSCLMFEHLELQIAWAVPVLLIIVNLFWNWANEESFFAWPSMAGIIAGFFLYPKVLPLLPINLISGM